MPNAMANKALGDVNICQSSSFPFSMFFTLLKDCSKGIKSGEYGGRNISLACAASMKLPILSQW